MPLLAGVVSAAINGLIAFFGYFFAANEAIAWARRTFIISLGIAWLAAIKVCMSALLSMISLSGLPDRFLMGLGMFIPANAAAVVACIGSVWLACVIYRLKVDGLRW